MDFVCRVVHLLYQRRKECNMSVRSTFFGIEIGRTGINVGQKGLDVTGHNISNVDTLGYTRQRLVTTAYEPFSGMHKFTPIDNALVGAGARVMILDQIRSKFLDLQYRTENNLSSYWDTRTQGLTYVRGLFEGSDISSLSDTLNTLFTAFNTETTEANDGEQRKLIQQSGINLTTNMNMIYDRLIDQQQDQDLAVKTEGEKVNTIAQSIVSLNETIYIYELTGGIANDLRDKRNLLLDELSGLVDITYEESMDNKLTVKIGDVELVNHTSSRTIGFEEVTNSLGPTLDNVSILVWQDAADPSIDGTAVKLTSGKIKSHMDLRDGTGVENAGIPYFVEQLNTLARALVQSINEVHRQGYTHPANPSGLSQTGVDFFDETAGIDNVTAGNIRLSQDILDSEYNIAASSEEIIAGNVVPGNQENIKAIYNLINSSNIQVTLGGGTTVSVGSFNSFITGLLLDVATTLQHSGDMGDTQFKQLTNIHQQRLSLSGVSLDEEMTNLIKYQHAYNGASRVITTMDEALETIINKMGLVGRS